MMMKKKMNDHEDLRHNNNHKATENKENTNGPDDRFDEKPLDSGSGELMESGTAGAVEEGVSSDKSVPEVRAAEEKLAEMQDKYIRLSAEFDNYRKRTLREKMDMSKYAGENLLLSIIPLMDDFERAISHMDSTSDCTSIRDGIDIIYGKFSDFLKQNGVKEIESLNTEFNVDLHDAVAKVPVAEEDKKGKVVDVVLKGYYLQDKVLRHSKVVVGE
jgi:molecular chaperone GrpE